MTGDGTRLQSGDTSPGEATLREMLHEVGITVQAMRR
jgi:hypothetical protein